MSPANLDILEGEEGCRFGVFVQPRASRDEIAGLRQGALRVRLTSPPLENRANRHLVNFLAGVLGVPRNRVSVVSGQRSRAKTVGVSGLSESRLLDLLAPYLVD